MKKYTRVILALFCSFSSLAADWQGPIDIFNSVIVENPNVGIDANGNAVIISIVNDSDHFFQKAAQLVEGNVQNIHDFTTSFESSIPPVISVNASGNAVAAWEEFDESSNNFLYSSNLTNNVWSTPFVVSGVNLPEVIPVPKVALDSSNKALAVWPAVNTITSTDLIQWNSFNNSWGSVQNLFDPNDFVPNIQLAGSPTGHAIAAWIVTGGSGDKLQAAFFDGTSWTVNPSVTQDVAVTCSSPSNLCLPILSVSINPSNFAIILWKDSSDGNLKSVVYGNGTYMPPLTVFAPAANENVSEASISIDPEGNALAVWNLENTNLQVSKILAAQFKNGTWSVPTILDSINEAFENFNSPGIGTDAKGNGFAVWEKISNESSTGEIYVNRYKSSVSAWAGENTLLSSPDFFNVDPKISVNSSGAATVVWSALGESTQIVQAAFIAAPIPPPPTPARNFTGRQVNNKFLDQSDLINILNWNPSLDSTVVGYNLYRYDKLIAFISAEDPLCYEDHNRKKKKKYIYRLTAVNAQGIESTSVTVKLP